MLSHNVIYLSATIIAQPIVSGWVCYGLLVSLMSHPSPANRRYRALWHCRDGQSGMRGKTHIIPTIQAYYHILSHDIFPYFPPIPWHVLHMLPPGFSRTRPCPVCFDPVTTLSTSCCCAGCGRPGLPQRDSGDAVKSGVFQPGHGGFLTVRGPPVIHFFRIL